MISHGKPAGEIIFTTNRFGRSIFPPEYFLNTFTMKNLKPQIEAFQKVQSKLYKTLLKEIGSFVKQHGHCVDTGCVRLAFDPDINDVIEPVYLCVETDRHFQEYGYEALDAIVISQKGDIFFEAESYGLSQEEISASQLIEVYEFLHGIEEDGFDGLEIVDGVMQSIL